MSVNIIPLVESEQISMGAVVLAHPIRGRRDIMIRVLSDHVIYLIILS